MSDRLLKESDVLRIAFQLPLVVNSAFADAVKALPSADKPAWIPCSERPPEEEGEYLVTAKEYAFDSSYYDVHIAYFSPNKEWFLMMSPCEIVAWMPKPKPFERSRR